ncbi:RNA-directed DNA polymerase [Methylobacterium sp. J-026]|nr:RNA-directed DNA polymerase [Methylobacterium sp. J-026]
MNRDAVVRGVAEAFSESTPIYVIRRDIKSFYETLPIGAVKRRLIYDTALPRSVRHYLRLFFEAHCANDIGLPRGVGLSSVLVELAMEPFDKSIRNLGGVYRYFRYADDILIFCYTNHLEIEKKIGEHLSAPMEFNSSKSSTLILANESKASRVNKHLDYLGYKFVLEDLGGQKKPRNIAIGLSERRIKKIKSRIVLSLRAYQHDSNAELLCQRMELLSGNYRIRRQGMTLTSSDKHVLAGIYYSYPHCGDYSGGIVQNAPPSELVELNSFFHNLIRGRNSRYRPMILAIPFESHRRRLTGISFVHGYSSKFIVKMNHEKLRLLGSAWRNVG